MRWSRRLQEPPAPSSFRGSRGPCPHPITHLRLLVVRLDETGLSGRSRSYAGVFPAPPGLPRLATLLPCYRPSMSTRTRDPQTSPSRPVITVLCQRQTAHGNGPALAPL